MPSTGGGRVAALQASHGGAREGRGTARRAARLDNGTEFTSKHFDAWAYTAGIQLDFISPGRPVENGYIESFNGKLRDECLGVSWFLSLSEAQEQSAGLAPRLQRNETAFFLGESAAGCVCPTAPTGCRRMITPTPRSSRSDVSSVGEQLRVDPNPENGARLMFRKSGYRSPPSRRTNEAQEVHGRADCLRAAAG